jgi:hypothetical protein
MGKHHVRVLQHLLETRSMLRLHQAVHVRDGDERAGLALPNPRFHPRHYTRNLYRVRADARFHGPLLSSKILEVIGLPGQAANSTGRAVLRCLGLVL